MSNGTDAANKAAADQWPQSATRPIESPAAGALTGLITNADLRDPMQLVSIVAAEIAEGRGVWEDGIKEAVVVYIVQRPFEAVDKKTGEVSGKWHTRLIAVDGSVIWTNSIGVARTMGLLLAAVAGKGPLDPPLVVTFKEKKLGQDATLLTADVDLGQVRALLTRALPPKRPDTAY